MMQTTGNRLVPTWNAYVMAFILIGVLQQGLFQHAAYADDSQDAQRSDGLIDYEYAGKQYYGYLATPPAWRVHGADSASINSNLDLNLKPTSIDQHSIQHNTPNSMTRVVNNPISVPGILLVHGSHGQTETTRQHARQLADQGYAVFAVDMYGRGVITPSPRSAARRAKSLLYSSSNQLSGRFMAAYNVLSNLPNVDSTRIGAVGYCFGGGVVLAMAEMNVDLAGVVSISGDLNYPEQKKQRHPAQARSAHAHPAVLVLHGASDSTLV
ncbi:MAG: dienelactone hydrolase family protein, partial [Gammaproteobacteria bacterium]